MGADIFYDDVPNFIRKYKDLHGKCRRNVEGCEDCRKTDVELIKNIHFTNVSTPKVNSTGDQHLLYCTQPLT